MRSSKLITSDLDSKFSEFNFKKINNDDNVYKLFLENIRKKKIEKKDIKLLQITGLEKIVEILKSREIYRQKTDGYRERENSAIQENLKFEDYKDIAESSFNIKINNNEKQFHLFNSRISDANEKGT